MKKIFQLLSLSLIFISCQKEFEDLSALPGTGGSGSGGSGGSGTPGTTCTGAKMYLVSKDGGSVGGKDSFAYDSQNRMVFAYFNSAGRVATPSYATFTYDANSRITKSVVKDISNGAILDIYIFSYRSDNKLDSIYTSGTSGNNYKLIYNTAGKLIKIVEYSMPSNTSDMYFVITTDANNNITRSVTWFLGASDDDLSYDYDTKSNPLAGYAFYFAGMDDIEDLVTYYGPNNFVTQTAKLDLGGGAIITVVTGKKYDYNNCYPAKDYNTINGIALFPNDPDFVYRYK